MICTPYMKKYFDNLEEGIKQGYLIAEEARKKGFDPEKKVDIPLARGISERVEGLISAVAEQILGCGVSKRIEELEKEYGSLDWRVACVIAEEVAKQKFCKFESEKEAMEVAIRVGLAYITLGVIAAPLEGFIELRLKDTRSGKKYFSAFFSGPIRAAGGTASAVTIIIADFVRIKMGYEKYDPDETEVKRYMTEIVDYHERASNLQYFPSEKELDFLVRHVPIELNGDPTEQIEVSNYKDQPRIETNRIRGGMCLALAEGLAQKAPKLWKQLDKWGKSMGLDWEWMGEFMEIQKLVKAKGQTSKTGEQPKITPNYTYIKDLVAGRPIFGHPLRTGGFRLRYGRTRTSGFAADAVHPCTMIVTEDYLATGTQLKMERPGKATVLSPCDYIEGPIVRLKNGDVFRAEDENFIRTKTKEIDKILFLGDLLINYGDFSENGHKLVPAGYCEEWWYLELEKQLTDKGKDITPQNISEITGISIEKSILLIKDPIKTRLTAKEAFEISTKLNIALHPYYTYFWGNLKKEELKLLKEKSKSFSVKVEDGELKKVVILYNPEVKIILEKIGLPHTVASNEFIIVEKSNAYSLIHSLNIEKDLTNEFETSSTTLEFLNKISGVSIKDKMGTFIGARMGRPEKAKMRKLQGSPHMLFPVGDEGGRLKSFQSAMEKSKIVSVFPTYYCQVCDNETVFAKCETCESQTEKKYFCQDCDFIKDKNRPDYKPDLLDKPCEIESERGMHRSASFRNKTIEINNYIEKFRKKYELWNMSELIKGLDETPNKNHEVEHLVKGVLRAKHNIYVNKEGTTRYDMIEMPITHFKPNECSISIEKLIEIGYEKDIHGNELTNDNQIIELKPQDMILPDCPDSPDEFASKVLINVCKFIDELLVKLYSLKPFYNVEKKEDLIGQLIIGLAPHTSAGIIGRIVGFSKTQGMYCHPMMHAAMRRNCDGDEACVMMMMDGLLNFSRKYLPDRRGSRTMDAPLVLTSLLIPAEVDDEVHGMDIVWKYPLELYEAALLYKNPWDVKVKQIDNVLDTEGQYEGMGYTHETSSINAGVLCSAYKTLPSMAEKLDGQMSLAEKILAVDEMDVATLVIEKHFIKDAKGNLRKFSIQKFRCVSCNEKYRRPPLLGFCTKQKGKDMCKGKIIFTIHEGSVIKYLQPSIDIANKYNVSPYLKQTLQLLKQQVEDMFGKDPEKQSGLNEWFG